jgi:Ca2+ transporting ATPase
MASKALRTIGICYKQVEKSECDFETPDQRGVYNFEKNGFIFVALFGIRDTIREEVPASIKQCNEAGIQVRMVTGDNKITARAIAYNIGLINSKNEANALIMEGPEFMKRIGGIVCANCRDLPDCTCVKNEYEQSKPENKDKKIRNDTIKNQDEFD